MAYLAGRVWTATSEGKAYIWDAKVIGPELFFGGLSN